MKQPKKIVFLYAMTWSGHKSIFKHLEKVYKEIFPNTEIKLIDAYDYVGFENKNNIVQKTNDLITNHPLVSKILNKLGHYRFADWIVKTYTNFSCPKNFHKIYENERPDMIICNQPFVLQNLSQHKKEFPCPILSYLIDFGWENINRAYCVKNVDGYIVPNEDVAKGMKKNIKIDKKVFNVNNFLHDFELEKPYDKNKIRGSLHLDENLDTLLISGGSLMQGDFFGFLKNILEIDPKIQIVIVCGNNEKAKNKFEKIIEENRKNNSSGNCKIHVIGFTNKFYDYIRACDLMYLVPGSTTVIEALSICKPMVIPDDVPEFNKGTRKFLKQKELAICLKTEKPELEVIELIKDKTTLKKIERRQRNISQTYNNRVTAINIQKSICEAYTDYLKQNSKVS